MCVDTDIGLLLILFMILCKVSDREIGVLAMQTLNQGIDSIFIIHYTISYTAM